MKLYLILFDMFGIMIARNPKENSRLFGGDF
jgi:hypothetical protein